MSNDTGAEFSPCRRYRYRLWRTWDDSKEKCCFIMLNPSTADEATNDPTVERCERRARAWGYGGLIVVNLFAMRSTDPKALYAEADPVGPKNMVAIQQAAIDSAIVVAAWGTHGALHGQGEQVAARLRRDFPDKARALRVNKDGSPAHPLYLPYTLGPRRWCNR